MRMPRLFHSTSLKSKERVALDPGPSKHVLTVLRLKSGAPLVLFDGSGFEFEAKLDQVNKTQVWVKLISTHRPKVESPLHVTLIQGVSRGERMDFTVQKAVELGIGVVVPVLTERSVVKLDSDNGARKRLHWQGIAIGACEQSGRVRVPEVKLPVTLTQFLASTPEASHKLLLDPLAGSTANDLPPPADHRVLLLAGPEGGLSENEQNLATNAGFTGLKLGPRILRTETAALVALSLLQAQWGDLT